MKIVKKKVQRPIIGDARSIVQSFENAKMNII